MILIEVTFQPCPWDWGWSDMLIEISGDLQKRLDEMPGKSYQEKIIILLDFLDRNQEV